MSGNLSIRQGAPKIKARFKAKPNPRSKFRFTKVPNSLLGRPQGLSDGANLTLQHLLARDFEDGDGRRKGYALASIGELAEARRRCTRTIRNHLKELLEKGYLSKIEGRRIYINYRRLGTLRRNFTIVPNRLLELDLPDGVILTLECLLREAGLPPQRGTGDRGRVSRKKLAEERGRTSRTIQRHLSRLKACNWQEASRLWEGEGVAAPTSTPAQNGGIFHHIMSSWLIVEDSVALLGKRCRLWWKKLSPPSNGRKSDGNGSFGALPSPHNTKTKTKIKTNDDTGRLNLGVRCRELRRFLESPKEGRRRAILIKRFGREAFVRALRQADLQYAHSPTKIRNPYGLLWTMLQDLDDTLLRAQEAREGKRRGSETEGLSGSSSNSRPESKGGRGQAGPARARSQPGALGWRVDPDKSRSKSNTRKTGTGFWKSLARKKSDWLCFVEAVGAERPFLAACLELCEHSFVDGRLRLRGDPFIRRSLGAAQGYLMAKAEEVFGERVRGGISIHGIDSGITVEGEGRRASRMKSAKRSRPESQELVLAGVG